MRGARRAGTVGMPLPGVEMRITDRETGAEVPSGEIGMLQIRGPNVFIGYWRMPEKTREELLDDGFLLPAISPWSTNKAMCISSVATKTW
ncbi:hypothetical protein HORIV_60500 [Vreelandella olivaria]|uniref:AMP-dependent synthetase/ligase domain-containing protein n=1 Tax=Vreelandella olivaria TaxID=390919 RepID=A0ABN5X2Z7_9GAMM|nr:hypothetical protein HORIV_60500 [Halomonas olivaria]